MNKTDGKGPIVVCCPTCRKEVVYRGLDKTPYFPFCSERCKLVDLDRWFEEDYVIESGSEDAGERPDEG